MSDRDGYWDSDWDPEVGIDPPNDRDCYRDPRCDDYDDHFNRNDARRCYVVFFDFGGVQKYVLLENRLWASFGKLGAFHMCPKGVLQIDQKWVAERLAAHYQCKLQEVLIFTRTHVIPGEQKTFDEIMQLKQDYLKKEEEWERQRIEQEKQREKERIEQEKREKELEEYFWKEFAERKHACKVFYEGKLMWSSGEEKGIVLRIGSPISSS